MPWPAVRVKVIGRRDPIPDTERLRTNHDLRIAALATD
jgi:hypothetical protein